MKKKVIIFGSILLVVLALFGTYIVINKNNNLKENNNTSTDTETNNTTDNSSLDNTTDNNTTNDSSSDNTTDNTTTDDSTDNNTTNDSTDNNTTDNSSSNQLTDEEITANNAVEGEFINSKNSSKIIFASASGIFTMTLNLCNNITTDIEGKYTVDDKTVNLTFNANQYSGVDGEDDTSYTFTIIDDNTIRFDSTVGSGNACGPFNGDYFIR